MCKNRLEEYAFQGYTASGPYLCLGVQIDSFIIYQTPGCQNTHAESLASLISV